MNSAAHPLRLPFHLYPSRESPEGDLGVGAARSHYPITLKTPAPEDVSHLFGEEDKCPDGMRSPAPGPPRHPCAAAAAFPSGTHLLDLATHANINFPIFPNIFPPNGDSIVIRGNQRVHMFSVFRENRGVAIQRTPVGFTCGRIKQSHQLILHYHVPPPGGSTPRSR